MPVLLNPEDTDRAAAYRLWDLSAQPRVTMTKTFDISPLLEKETEWQVLLSWCIARAASGFPEFFRIPCSDGFLSYDQIGAVLEAVFSSGKENVTFIPYHEKLKETLQALETIRQIQKTEGYYNVPEDYMILQCGSLPTDHASVTSASVNSSAFPYFIWCEVQDDGSLPVSFIFHHAQMDGYEAAVFLETLQNVIFEEKC